jgi:hypothetical protein
MYGSKQVKIWTHNIDRFDSLLYKTHPPLRDMFFLATRSSILKHVPEAKTYKQKTIGYRPKKGSSRTVWKRS